MGCPTLEPVRLAGHEGINSLFEYELLLKTPDALNLGASGAADLDLDSFIGREIRCSIDLDGMGQFLAGAVGASVDHIGAGVREINALITEAQLWGEEGRHIQYRLTLRPWLHLATLTIDCKIFQNKTVVDILDELLADYAFPVDKRLIETYPVRDHQTQYNESDFEFFVRLCEEWAINYFFEHSEGKHRLVLIDNMGSHTKNHSAAYQQVEYHAAGWKVDAEYVHAFAPNHRLTSGRYITKDYDYTRPRADLTSGRKDPRPTGHADGEVYQWHAGNAGSHYAQPRAGNADANDPQAEGDQLARVRMEALRTHGARARASGNLRGMVPGCTFRLNKHPRESANAEYLILGTDFTIEDVAQDSQTPDATRARRQQWRVAVDFTAHPVSESLRPETTRGKPLTHGPQVALVVGPEGQNLWTDEFGRIKVQFPWDRIGQKNQHSTCWLRVSSPWAGNQLGGVHIPRIGQEVVVDFIGGDPDLPICTGRVHNQLNLPPWSLPTQSALSGFRSRELTTGGGGNSAAGRSNHLLMDDTSGKIQAQLKSDHQHSQLSLGFITRVEDNAGRKDPRGEGFELRTDGHGVVRAKDGLLISTEARDAAAGHAKDMNETVARLAQARDLHESLGSAAQEAQAQSAGDQDDVATAIKRQNDAIKGAGKQTNPESDAFPELDEPHLLVASAAGLQCTSTQSTHVHAGEHVALTSGAHTSLSAAKSFLASAREAIRFFAYRTGIRMFAFGGDIDIKALEESISILAKLNIVQVANKITITAKEELVLNGGGSFIRLNASGIEDATAGRHIEYAATHIMAGPKNAPTQEVSGTSSLKDVKTSRTFVLRSHPEDGRPVAIEPYTLYKDGAEIGKGVTDAQGRILMEDHKPGTRAYKIKLSNGHEFELPVTPRLEGLDQHLSAKGYRAAQGDPKDRKNHAQHRQGSPDEI
ncbi:type VI secretion system tip protein TssI/VgrG [Variovorax sp. J22R133]|uniref:type VI secretion system Vgr family protein n=1 Tax=Variovorax brevis TaxID=3053503 RepID=UPI002576EA17|nr:type VI secretion system Vgr family protein [Variovorax sp. J22R133]MDM0114510.1 type VI secretion system tip protein TssI/VgrG [Variovorax sp. J22R133]